MIRRLILSWLVLLALTAFTWRNPDPLDLNRVETAMMYPGVHTTIRWEKCGEVNAYYYPPEKVVIMCHELLSLRPSIIRYILAHELAHGVILQRGVPFTGSHEVAADELAALALINEGMSDDIMDAAKFWMDRGFPEIASDDHPGDAKRGYTLRCIAWSRDHVDYFGMCPRHYIDVARAWNQLLPLEDSI